MSLVQAVVPLVGAAQQLALMAVGRPAAQGAFFILFSYFCLTWAFIQSDFSRPARGHQLAQRHPADVQDHRRGAATRLAAAVGDVAVAVDGRGDGVLAPPARRLPRPRAGRARSGRRRLHLLHLVTSNPFDRLLPAVAEGRDLNPLLQDPG